MVLRGGGAGVDGGVSGTTEDELFRIVCWPGHRVSSDDPVARIATYGALQTRVSVVSSSNVTWRVLLGVYFLVFLGEVSVYANCNAEVSVCGPWYAKAGWSLVYCDQIRRL